MWWISDLEFNEHLFWDANIFIKSPMGTGKTTLAQTWIEKKFYKKRVLILSVWRTYSHNILKKFPGFVLYEDISSKEIHPEKYPRLICQIDSVGRIPQNELGFYDVVIFDEIESIFTHCAQDSSIAEKYKFKSLINLLSRSSTKIFLDSFLLDKSVDVVRAFSKSPVFRINNTCAPYTEHTFQIYPYHAGNYIFKIADYIL